MYFIQITKEKVEKERKNEKNKMQKFMPGLGSELTTLRLQGRRLTHRATKGSNRLCT